MYPPHTFCMREAKALASLRIILVPKSYVLAHIESIFEPVHEISNNVVCATSKASDQPAHTRSLIRVFACRLSIL